MRVHVVNPAERAAYGAELDAMHRHRRRIFVEILGWSALGGDAGREMDSYDASATYLLALDEGGVLRGSLRLVATTGPHMLTDVFADFLDAPAPRGPAIMEWTRHAPGDPAWPPEVNAAARIALHLGVLEYAVREGLTGFTALMESWLLRPARALGWPCTPLGAPRRFAEGVAVAVFNPVAPDHLHRLRQRTGRHAPVLAPGRAAA